MPSRLRLALLPGRQSGSEQRGTWRDSAAGHVLAAVFTGKAFPRIAHSKLSSTVIRQGVLAQVFIQSHFVLLKGEDKKKRLDQRASPMRLNPDRRRTETNSVGLRRAEEKKK